MGSPVIFSGSDAKTLKQNINLFDVVKILSGGVNPTVTATSANKGSIYLSTLTGKLYVKTDAGSSTNWDELNASSVGTKEVPTGTLNGINVSFNITYTPVDDTLLVLRDGLVVPSSEYSFAHPTITFNTAPHIGAKLEAYYLTTGTPALVPVATTRNVEYRTLTGGEITAKQITLAHTPAVPNQVLLDVITGSSQEYSVDYVVSGAILDWSGLGLDGTLIAGSKLRIDYYY